jgi:hypothetical protein
MSYASVFASDMELARETGPVRRSRTARRLRVAPLAHRREFPRFTLSAHRSA